MAVHAEPGHAEHRHAEHGHDRRAALLHAGVEFVREVALVFGAILLYFLVRGLTEGSPELATAHGHDVLAFERTLGVQREAGVQAMVSGDVRTTLVNWVYIWGHWPVITVVLIALHHFRRRHYLLLRNAMFLSGAIGLFIFALYPVAPPRLLDVGLADTVTLHSHAYRVLQPPALTNQYAALPSLHVGWNLLVGISLWRASRHPLVRCFAVLSPLAMAFAVVATANHYLVDGVAGSALSLAAFAAAGWFTAPIAAFAARSGRTLVAHHALPPIVLPAALAELDDELPVVDDEALDPPAGQLVGPAPVGHRPTHDPPAPRP